MSRESQGVLSPDQPTSGDDRPMDAQPTARRAGGATLPRRRGSDHYDPILWRVLPATPVISGFALGVTGCGRRVGATTVAANLAIRAADHRRTPVLVVDANLDHPRIARRLRVAARPGLAEVLAGQCGIDDATPRSRKVEGLSVMPIGRRRLLGQAALDPDAFASLLTELRDRFATIVLDLPDARQMRRSLPIAQQVDAALLVLRSESTRIKTATAAAGRLTSDGVPVAGTVVTHRKSYIPGWFQGWL